MLEALTVGESAFVLFSVGTVAVMWSLLGYGIWRTA